MQASLSDQEIRMLLEKLRHDFNQFPPDLSYLDKVLESAAKHIPAYLKIVKGHIEQLADVLKLETHYHRTLESIALEEPVVQLMQLFRALEPQDIPLFQTLAYEAGRWEGVDETIGTAVSLKELSAAVSVEAET